MIGVALVLCLAVPPASTFWIEPGPQDPAEEALQAAAGLGRSVSPAAGATALLGLSAVHPASLVSGLAQLGAGFLLTEAGRTAEAQAAFDHPDVARTGLPDLRLIGKGLAWDKARDFEAAARSYQEALGLDSGLLCSTLLRAAEATVQAGRPADALPLLQKHLITCPGQEPGTLLRLATLQETIRDLKGAFAAYDRLDRDFPTTPQGRQAGAHLRRLAAVAPALPAADRNARDLAKAGRLHGAGAFSEALGLYRSLLTRPLGADDTALVRVRVAQSLLGLRRGREVAAVLAGLAPGSPHEAEAAYTGAQVQDKPAAYEAVAARYPGTPWAEEALAAAGWCFQKKGGDAEALPYYRRLVLEFPDGRKLEQAAWRVAWADYRAGRLDESATLFERVARARPTSSYTPAFLYWAGRARREQGQPERGRDLLEETVRRYKYTYHGLRAREALGPAVGTGAALHSGSASLELPERNQARVRQMLLIERLDEATAELSRLPMSPPVQATLAWVQWRKGDWRPAIISMKRAYPDYTSEAGDRLPPSLWKILYPLQHTDGLKAKAQAEGLDPALVAALVWQESTFDAGAQSPAGARGLMQVMPGTGRQLARHLGRTFRLPDLYDADVSLQMGTRYLRQLMDRFGGRIERALAAYNAGPSRVVQWTAANPEMSAEEFVEAIPFRETKGYVMNILAHREHYRRLYGLAPTATAGAH